MLLGVNLRYHGEFEDMVLRWELDQLADAAGLGIAARCRNLFRYLRDNPEARIDGRLLADLAVEEAVRRSTPNADCFALKNRMRICS